MRNLLHWLVSTLIAVCLPALAAETAEQVVDIPTRPGMTQRLLVLAPPRPLASVAYHGFNGLDAELVPRIAAWMLAK